MELSPGRLEEVETSAVAVLSVVLSPMVTSSGSVFILIEARSVLILLVLSNYSWMVLGRSWFLSAMKVVADIDDA